MEESEKSIFFCRSYLLPNSVAISNNIGANSLQDPLLKMLIMWFILLVVDNVVIVIFYWN